MAPAFHYIFGTSLPFLSCLRDQRPRAGGAPFGAGTAYRRTALPRATEGEAAMDTQQRRVSSAGAATPATPVPRLPPPLQARRRRHTAASVAEAPACPPTEWKHIIAHHDVVCACWFVCLIATCFDLDGQHRRAMPRCQRVSCRAQRAPPSAGATNQRVENLKHARSRCR